jgi:hypothetical protein
MSSAVIQRGWKDVDFSNYRKTGGDRRREFIGTAKNKRNQKTNKKVERTRIIVSSSRNLLSPMVGRSLSAYA